MNHFVRVYENWGKRLLRFHFTYYMTVIYIIMLNINFYNYERY